MLTPRTVEEAVEALGAPDAVAVAGGTAVGLLLSQRLLQPSTLVLLGRVRELGGVEVDEEAGTVRIGAAVTMAELARHRWVARRLPALATAAGVVGNPRVRALATLGGAIAHADPRQDVPPVLVALDAAIDVAGPGGRRVVRAADMFLGVMDTDLDDVEVVTGVRLAAPPGLRSAYERFTPQSAEDYPTVAAAAAVQRAEDGVVRWAALVLGGVGAAPVTVAATSELTGRVPAGAAVAAVAAQAAVVCAPTDDRRGSARYKRAMAEVWSRRALQACLAD